MNNFIDESKKLHSINESVPYSLSAFDPTIPDTTRHHNMLSTCLPILNFFQPKNLLTIGDNRGRDAVYIKSHFKNTYCIASDLNTSKIQDAVKDGYLDEVKNVDVEKIPYEDNSIDFILAKESFHHWPRPMLGLYETLRVAKYGVILIEPHDCFCSNKLPKSYPSKDEYQDSYEEVGNYKYQLSIREMHKTAWSLYYPVVISKGFNDSWTPNFNVDEYLKQKNYLDQLGINNQRLFNLHMVCILKNWDSNLKNKLDSTYDISIRPLNEYLPNDKIRFAADTKD